MPGLRLNKTNVYEKNILSHISWGTHPSQPDIGRYRVALMERTPAECGDASGCLLVGADSLAQGGAHHHPALSSAILRRLSDGTHLSLWARTYRRRHVAQPRHHKPGRGGRTALTTDACHRMGGNHLYPHAHAGSHTVAATPISGQDTPAPTAPTSTHSHRKHSSDHHSTRGSHPLCAHDRPVPSQCRIQLWHRAHPAESHHRLSLGIGILQLPRPLPLHRLRA